MGHESTHAHSQQSPDHDRRAVWAVAGVLAIFFAMSVVGHIIFVAREGHHAEQITYVPAGEAAPAQDEKH